MLSLARLSAVTHLAVAELTGHEARNFQRARQVGALDREGHVCGAVDAGVLHDDVHADVGLAERLEQAGSDARPVDHAADGDLGDVGVDGDAPDAVSYLADGCVHIHSFVNESARRIGEAGCDQDGDLVEHAHFNRSRVHLRAIAGELQHLFVVHLVQLAGFGHQPGVGGVDALDVGVHLAARCFQAGGERDRGGVGTAAPQRGSVQVLGDALEARHDDYAAQLQLARDPFGLHQCYAGTPVAGVGAYAGLRAAQADGLVAQRAQGHGYQRAGNQLARGEQQVELSRLRPARNLARQLDELVGGVAHGRDHADDVVAGVARPPDSLSHVSNLGGVGQRASAILLDYQGQDFSSWRRGSRTVPRCRRAGVSRTCPAGVTRSPGRARPWRSVW